MHMLKRLACMLAPALALGSHTASAAGPSIQVTSAPRVLYSAMESGCPPNFIPDSPARAFRRADGNMELLAEHYDDWRMIGRTFFSLKSDCHAIMAYDAYHLDVPGQLWIQATYTLDGRHIEGLASQDLSTTMFAQGCERNLHGHCWINQILSVRSGDMGNNFIPGPAVASYGDTYPPTEPSQYGFFTATNIVHEGGFYYVVLFQTPPHARNLGVGNMQSGNCLFRTNNILNPASWRGWSGTGFTYEPDRGSGQCTLIANPGWGPFRSLEYIPRTREFVAMTAGRHQLPGDSAPIPGFYALTSTDLIHWGGAMRVMQAPMSVPQDNPRDWYSYPSLLDPDSTSMNFDTLDHDTAVLVFSVHHFKNGHGTMNRDLEYVPVQIR